MSNLNLNSFNEEFFPKNPISSSTFRRLCRSGKLPGSFKLGGAWYVNSEVFSLEAFNAEVNDSDSDDDEMKFLDNLNKQLSM